MEENGAECINLWFLRHQLEGDTAQGPVVDRGAIVRRKGPGLLPVGEHLWGHVGPGASYLVGVHFEGIERASVGFRVRRAEVRDTYIAISIEENIFRLEIAVDDARRVDCGHAQCLECRQKCSKKKERKRTIWEIHRRAFSRREYL
jgi:hypothetical protein